MSRRSPTNCCSTSLVHSSTHAASKSTVDTLPCYSAFPGKKNLQSFHSAHEQRALFFTIMIDSTEKAPGMFATMVIALPSEHTGGEVEVHLRSEKKTLATDKSSAFGYSYLAWYADVNHSVKPVISGYRLVLTYNILHVSSDLASSRPPSILDDHKGNINKALAEWNSRFDGAASPASRLLYMMEHEYSEANIGMGLLKGKDQLRASCLFDAAQQNGFHLFFAHFVHTRSGGCDEDYYGHCGYSEDDGDDSTHVIVDEVDSSWKLVSIFTSKGHFLAGDMEVDHKDFIQAVTFDDEEPDDEDYEGWTGNAGAEATHYSRRSCMVIVPKILYSDFLGKART